MKQINPRSPSLIKVFKFLIAALIGGLIALTLFSCGSRKTNKEHSKEEIKSEVVDNSVIEKQTDTNVKTTTTIKIDDKNETVTEETTISPEDNTKEAFIIDKDGTKVVLNNTKKVYKKTTQKNNTQTDALKYIDEAKKDIVKEQKAIKEQYTDKKENSVKNIDKKAYNPLNFIWIGLIILFVLFIAYRVYKKLPLLPKF